RDGVVDRLGQHGAGVGVDVPVEGDGFVGVAGPVAVVDADHILGVGQRHGAGVVSGVGAVVLQPGVVQGDRLGPTGRRRGGWAGGFDHHCVAGPLRPRPVGQVGAVGVHVVVPEHRVVAHVHAGHHQVAVVVVGVQHVRTAAHGIVFGHRID